MIALEYNLRSYGVATIFFFFNFWQKFHMNGTSGDVFSVHEELE